MRVFLPQKTKPRKRNEKHFYIFFFSHLRIKHILLHVSSSMARSLEKSPGQRLWTRRTEHTNCSSFSLGRCWAISGETRGEIGWRSLESLWAPRWLERLGPGSWTEFPLLSDVQFTAFMEGFEPCVPAALAPLPTSRALTQLLLFIPNTP